MPRSPRPPPAHDPLPRGAPAPHPVASAHVPAPWDGSLPASQRQRAGGGGERAATPRLLVVRREPAPYTPQPPGPRRPLLSPGTPAFPPPGACPRRRQSCLASRPRPPPLRPQGPGRVPERGLRLRVACVVRAGRRVHRWRRAGGAAGSGERSGLPGTGFSLQSPNDKQHLSPYFCYGPRKRENSFRQLVECVRNRTGLHRGGAANGRT